MSDWQETTLGKVAAINPESTPKSWRADREIRYVDIASVSKERGIDEANLAPIAFGAAPGRARRVIRPKDVLALLSGQTFVHSPRFPNP